MTTLNTKSNVICQKSTLKIKILRKFYALQKKYRPVNLTRTLPRKWSSIKTRDKPATIGVHWLCAKPMFDMSRGEIMSNIYLMQRPSRLLPAIQASLAASLGTFSQGLQLQAPVTFSDGTGHKAMQVYKGWMYAEMSLYLPNSRSALKKKKL